MTQKDQCDVACVSNALEHCRERRNKGLAAVLAHLQALPSSSPGFEEGRGDKKKKKKHHSGELQGILVGATRR